LIVEFEGFDNVEALKDIDGVEEVFKIQNLPAPMESGVLRTGQAGSKFKILPKAGVDLRPEIFRFAADRKLSLLGLKQEENSLESVFRLLTGPV